MLLPGDATLACSDRNRRSAFHQIIESNPMARRLLSTGSPFERQGGYSRAVVDGDFCFVAGTTGYDYATMKMPVSVADQARNVFRTFVPSPTCSAMPASL